MKNNFLNNSSNNPNLIKQKLVNIQKQQKLPYDDLDEIEPTIPIDWLKPNKKQIKELKIKKKKEEKNNSSLVRPWSAYALFFREIQNEIREEHIGGNISFGELSKIIASKWEKMNKKDKMVYSEQIKERRRRMLRAKANVHALKLIFGKEKQ